MGEELISEVESMMEWMLLDASPAIESTTRTVLVCQ
jgi:hypothetical protein